VDRLRDIDEATRTDYRRKIGHHFTRYPLGAMPVDRLDESAVTDWLDALTPIRGSKPMADKTKRNLHSLLSAALARQVDAGTVRINPAKGLAPKATAPAREAVYLSPAAVERLVKLTPASHRLLVRTLAGTGLRWGEATALQPRHVQIRRDGRVVLQVRQAWKRGSDTATRLGDPKTPRSVRDVACSPELSAALREHLDRAAAWLFTNGAGGPVLNANFNRDTWPMLADAMVTEGFTWERPQVKALRHSHCTHLLDAGVRVDVVQKRLGHESPATTLGVYARMTQDDDLAAADAVSL
jgi:integrase